MSSHTSRRSSFEQQRGRLFVISAPSGAGKTTLVNELVRQNPGLKFSISYTTRRRRDNEVEAKDYFFVTKEQFRDMVDRQEFLEHANVFDNHYGTGRGQVEELLEEGHNVILEIDWQGARQVRVAMPECCSIFVLPPSRGELSQRLRKRSTDSDTVIQRRLRDSVADMSHWHEFDYVVVNDDFAAAAADLAAIIHGRGDEHSSSHPSVVEFARRLLGQP